jgi:hypothetical protein
MNSLPISTVERHPSLPSTSRRMHRLSALCALLLCFAFVSSALAGGPFCAIAYSPSTYRVGWSHSHYNRASAEAAALSGCGAYDARIVVWVASGYAALAVDKTTGRYGYGYGGTLRKAKRNAISGCNSPNAQIVQTVWSGV